MKSSKNSYKNFIKAKVRTAALKHLNNLKGTHSKIQAIEYVELKTQSYITSPIFSNDDVSFLYSLRSRSIDCIANFKSIYKDEYTGEELPMGHVRNAMLDELEYFCDKVWVVVPMEETQ